MLTFLILVSSVTPLLVGASFMLVPVRQAGMIGLAAMVCAGGALAIPAFYMARWDFLGSWAKAATVVLLVGVAVWRIWGTMSSPRGMSWPIGMLVGAALAVVVGLMSLWVIRRQPDGAGIDLHMPLATGKWYVAHGGGSILTNHHHSVRAQRFALDITVVNHSGRRARSLQSSSLEDSSVRLI
jgi:Co/Zn/Cd efflux system component